MITAVFGGTSLNCHVSYNFALNLHRKDNFSAELVNSILCIAYIFSTVHNLALAKSSYAIINYYS
jgi:hypothetical protein